LQIVHSFSVRSDLVHRTPQRQGGLWYAAPMSEVIPYSPASIFQDSAAQMIELARPIRATDWIIDIATTGAAGFLRFALWAEPGASDNLMGERWTYAQQHTDELLGRQPPDGRYSRQASAMAMAAAAFTNARRVAFERGLHGRPVMGVAMTAAVATGAVRRGADTCRIAVRTEAGFHLVDAVFDKASLREQTRGERRLEEGIACDLLTLLAMRSVMGLQAPVLDPGWGVHAPEIAAGAPLAPSHVDHTPLSERDDPFYQVLMPDQTLLPIADAAPDDFVLLPGSFNPFHHGHEQIAAMAREQTGKDVIFQITAHHPAKGVIPTPDLLARAAQLQFRWPVVLFDTEGLYADKARRVPGMTMLIGADVVYGLQDLRYYNQDKAERRRLFAQLDALGTTFLVAGRAVDGYYETLGDIPVAGNVSHLFRPLGGRIDISSTQLRTA
jgi:phosphopantetheine adenylyltransferase